MQLTILGNNGPFPAAGGAASGYLVQTEAARILLDMGTGTLAALTALMPPENLTAIVFSHWHSDHCSDVLPFLYRLQFTGAHMEIYGPDDRQSPVRAVLAADPGVTLHTIAPGDEITIGGASVRVFAARHPVPAVMLRLQADGAVLCYTGDTNTVPHLDAFAQGADLLLADAAFPRAAWAEGKPHLSAALCGELAARAGVRSLLLTHLSPLTDEQLLLREAREAFPAAQLSVRGRRYEVSP